MWFDLAAKHKPLPDEYQRALARRANEGDAESKSALVLSHVRYLIAKIESISPSLTGTMVEPDDLMSAGLGALNQAVQRYDPAKGTFLTYARHDIDGAIARELRSEANQVLVEDAIRDCLDVTGEGWCDDSYLMTEETEVAPPCLLPRPLEPPIQKIRKAAQNTVLCSAKLSLKKLSVKKRPDADPTRNDKRPPATF